MAPSAVLSQKFPVLFSSQQIPVFTHRRVLHLWRAKETFIQKQLPQSAVKPLLIKAGAAASLQVCTPVSGSNIYEYFIIFAVSFGVELDLTANRDMDFATSDARPLCMIQLYQRVTKIFQSYGNSPRGRTENSPQPCQAAYDDRPASQHH